MALFPSGRSGNPGGRPRGQGDAAKLARRYTAEAIFALARIACDVRAPPALQRQAALDLIRIGYGRAAVQGKQACLTGEGLGRWPGLRTNILQLLERHELDEGLSEPPTPEIA